jgi:hypothetical protein
LAEALFEEVIYRNGVTVEQMRWRVGAVAIVLVTTFVSGQVQAGDDSTFPTELLTPTMSISRSSMLTPSMARSMVAAATSVGAVGHVVSFPMVSLTAQRRNNEAVLRLTNGWRIPMATMVAPLAYIAAIGGQDMANAASNGSVLMGETSAGVRGAQVGDVMTLRDRRFQPKQFTVGAIVPDQFVDWGDFFMTDTTANVLGTLPISRVIVTGMTTSKSVIAAWKAKRFPIGSQFRLRTSWDRVNPDGTLGTATTKKLLGELIYKPTTGSSMLVDATWATKNIVWKKVYRGINLANNCHKTVAEAIQNALSEIKAAGLSNAIDVRNSNRYGGCFVGRYNRAGGVFGSPSRHAWGMAVDINTATNPQGGVPQMNCSVVRIFRKWGFAWGGNFWPADGMHFEYVGERRDKYGYPSTYCPNKVPVPTTTLPVFGESTTTSSTTTSTTDTTLPVTSIP